VKRTCLITAYTDPSFRGNTAHIVGLLSLRLPSFRYVVTPTVGRALSSLVKVELCDARESRFTRLFRFKLPPVTGHRLVKPGMILGSFLSKVEAPRSVDLIHAYNKIPICNKPFVCSFDTSPFDSATMWGLRSGQEIDPLTRRFYSSLFEGILSSQNCKKVIFWSHTAARSFLRDVDVASKVSVVPPFVETPARNSKAPRSEIPTVVMVGTQAMRKGADVLVDAFQRLDPGTARLMIIGIVNEGLRRKIAENRNIVHIPYLTHELVVRDVLPNADIFCLPSRAEGSPISILEAMASGLPVIATDVYGIPEEVRHGLSGILVSPNDAAGLHEALLRLLADTKRRKKMGRIGRRIVEKKFSPKRVAHLITRIYDDALSDASDASKATYF